MAHMAKVQKTNAMRELERAGISYTLRTYEDDGVEASGLGVSIAEQLGDDPMRGFKTLVTVTSKGDHVVCCVPSATEIDLKAAAKAVGEKSLSMLHMKDLLPVTGYVRGGCSPIGMKKCFRTVFDESINDWDSVYISGGRRGYSLELAPADLVGFTGAVVAPIAKER